MHRLQCLQSSCPHPPLTLAQLQFEFQCFRRAQLRAAGGVLLAPALVLLLPPPSPVPISIMMRWCTGWKKGGGFSCTQGSLQQPFSPSILQCLQKSQQSHPSPLLPQLQLSVAPSVPSRLAALPSESNLAVAAELQQLQLCQLRAITALCSNAVAAASPRAKDTPQLQLARAILAVLQQ